MLFRSLAAGASDTFARGMSAVKTNDLTAAAAALVEMKARREAAGGHTMMGNDHHSSSYAAPADLQAAEIMEKELEALLRKAEGKDDEAVRLMKEAARAEDAMSFEVGPPGIVKPSHELLGELLLEIGRPAESRKQFDAALARAPGRALSLLGLARAATGSGDHATARQSYDELQKVWHRADPGLGELKEIAVSLKRT